MQSSEEKIWGAAQEQLRSMLVPDTYNLWFAPLRACGQHDNTLVLEVANDFCELWLKDNYLELLQQAVALASGQQMAVNFKVALGTTTPSNPPPEPAPANARGVRSAPERDWPSQ